MMVEKEVLGLSLGLSCSSSSSSSSSENHQRSPLQLTLMPMSISSSLPLFLRGKPQPQHQWADLMAPSEMLKEIDVNRLPTGEKEKEEEEAGVSSPNNSTFSSVSAGKRDLAAFSGGAEEHDGERACSRGSGGSDEEDGEGSRKKLRLSKDQSAILEENFKEHNTLNPKQKLTLAKQLNLRPRQVEVWFQNRRARTKLKQTEVDCEFLKRCCDNLTEENRRLQKEVAELRALKLSPQFYMHMTPPTTLTMCPSCERMQLSNKTANNNEGNSSKGSLIYGDKPSVSPWALIPLRPPFVHAAPQRS